MVALLLLVLAAACQGKARQPNILFIMADDLGWNDVSWNNGDMPTENLARLAEEGIRLDRAYSQQVCTPSRAAFLTGRYPFRIGRQKRALKPLQPTGLALNLTTLADELKGLGYDTHMVGKWHLGYCASEYTPTRRGFDSFLGFYLGSQNHFTHDRDYKSQPEDPPAFIDFREGEEVASQYSGVYSTEIFKERTKDIIKNVADRKEVNAYGNYKPFFTFLSFQATHAPLQARAEVMERIPESGNPARDIYKAMVMDMDMAVAEIVTTLKETGLYNDTLIVFTSDNGGAISHGASNWPLRGTKGTLFEGGTRAVTFVHSPHLVQRTSYVSNNLVHITDWMPTLLSAAGYPDSVTALGLDGVDQWPALVSGGEGGRQEMVYNLKVDPMSGAIRLGKYKIIFGKKFNKQGWYNTDNTALQCARMGKDRKTKRKNKVTIDRRQGRKMRTKKSEYFKGKKSKNPSKTKRGRSVTKGNGKKIKKKRMREREKLKLKKERDRKKLKTIRERKKKQKLRQQKQEQIKEKKKQREKKKQKAQKKKQRRNKTGTKGTNELYKRSKKKRQINKSSFPKPTQSRGGENPVKDLSRQRKRDERQSTKNEKKLTKIWKDWLPMPSPAVKNLLRSRMDNCNWEDFSDSGHSNMTNLMPRSDLLHGDIVELWAPVLNPYHISADDEAREFEDDEPEERMDDNLEKKFDRLDVALYDLEADPEERTDLKHELPEVFTDLRRRALLHLAQVVPEDFPAQDFSGHPRHFGGTFSPGWCRPKYA